MNRLTQLITDSEQDTGIAGDCFRTALACLLNCTSPEEVPHFYKDVDMSLNKISDDKLYTKINDWLAENYGVRLFGVAFVFSSENQVHAHMRNWFCGIPYLITGQGPREYNHVLACSDNIIWDPHPNRLGLIGPIKNEDYFFVEVLAKI